MSTPQPQRKPAGKVRMLRGGAPVRITDVKAIRPVRRTDEEELRAQLQQEIASRARTCAHRGYECTLPVLTGRSHCARHVLAEPGAPYLQCGHVHPNGLRCPLVLADDGREHRDQGLCFEHARLALTGRQRSAAPPPPVTTTETLLNQLQHYIRPARVRTASCASSVSVVSEHAEHEPLATQPVDPFKQIDAPAINAAYSASIMECASDSDSDRDSAGGGGGGGCDHDPDHDTPPAERLPLWHAGVFTAEEAVRCARGVLRALQAAYAAQVGHLRVRLAAARACYLRDLRAEREMYCSINAQAKQGPLTARERAQLAKLKAYAGHRRAHGPHAVLARRLQRKRARMSESVGARCTFVEGGVRCERGSLPAAKHCLKHILLDTHQVLFAACPGAGGAPCREPVARLPLPSATCRYHAGRPPYSYCGSKKDSSEAGSHTTEDSQLEAIEDGSTEQSSPGERERDRVVEVESVEVPMGFEDGMSSPLELHFP